jgi:hypothetical protein
MQENKLIEKDNKYYIQKGKELEKCAIFTDHYYSLKPCNNVPLLEIDGIRMHLVKDYANPLQFPKEAVKEIKIKSTDIVFDCCGGLGYFAIEASKKAKKVISCELKKEVLQLGKLNPYSKEYFNSKNIEIKNKSCFDFIKTLDKESIDVIMHDPPTILIAGELYSLEFYKQISRVLKPSGLFFHYIGSTGKNKGRRFDLEIIKRLNSAGFKKCKYNEKLQSIICYK